VDQPLPKPRRRLLRHAATVALALVWATCLVLWFCNAELDHVPALRPAAAAHVPGWFAQIAARQDGVHCLVSSRSWTGPLLFRLSEDSNYGAAGYHYGLVLNALGLQLALLTRTIHDYDVIMLPYAAVVLPYCLLIVGSSVALLWQLNLLPLVRASLRFSRAAKVAMAVAAIAFVVANCIPWAWRPGAAISPDELWLVCLEPHRYPEVCLTFGFPFDFYQRGIMDGQAVQYFYGAEMEFHQHRLMDNVCLGFLAMMAAGMLVNRLRWPSRQSPAS
jgi:hypothetical protein